MNICVYLQQECGKVRGSRIHATIPDVAGDVSFQCWWSLLTLTLQGVVPGPLHCEVRFQ